MNSTGAELASGSAQNRIRGRFKFLLNHSSLPRLANSHVMIRQKVCRCQPTRQNKIPESGNVLLAVVYAVEQRNPDNDLCPKVRFLCQLCQILPNTLWRNAGIEFVLRWVHVLQIVKNPIADFRQSVKRFPASRAGSFNGQRKASFF